MYILSDYYIFFFVYSISCFQPPDLVCSHTSPCSFTHTSPCLLTHTSPCFNSPFFLTFLLQQNCLFQNIFCFLCIYYIYIYIYIHIIFFTQFMRPFPFVLLSIRINYFCLSLRTQFLFLSIYVAINCLFLFADNNFAY